MNISLQLDQEIPSNKFYPPRIDLDHTLFRKDLIADFSTTRSVYKKNLVIEAQAGQGKTTLIAQFLDHYGHRYGWYQIGQEDHDPVLFLTALMACLTRALPQFSSPRLENIIRNGELGTLDLNRCANILLADLDRFLVTDFFLVFDDIHLLEESELSNNFLDYIFDTSPPRLHFILATRRPLLLKAQSLKYSQDTTYIDNSTLAMSSTEVENLFTSVLNLPLPREDVAKIHDLTDGWPMGLIMAAHKFDRKSREPQSASTGIPSFSTMKKGHYVDYFRDEILTQIPVELHEPLLRLSLLEEIPVSLATQITGLSDINAILTDMMLDNYFVRSLDSDNSIFRFHHLFQEFLQIQAKRRLRQSDIDAIYQSAARFYLKQNFPEKALRYYLAQNNYQAMETVLKEEGMALISRNRTVTIYSLLNSIDEDIILKHPWLSLFSGLIFSDFTPVKTLHYLESAKNIFRKQQEEIGELITIAQTIYFHFVVSGFYNTGATMLPRAQQLFSDNKENLSDYICIMVARNIAAGLCFFKSDMQSAKEYALMAQKMATNLNVVNYIVSTRFIQGYIELLQGHRSNCQREAEISYSLLGDPLVGFSNKLSLRVMHICDLSMHGDYDNFSYQVVQLEKTISKKMINQTVTGPLIYIWGCANCLGQGRYAEAMELINKGADQGNPASTPHMKSQLLQWKASLHAFDGEHDQALSAISESRELRRSAGGPFYEAFNSIMAGAVYRQLQMYNEAKDVFASALTMTRQIPSKYLEMCCLMNRAFLYLQMDIKKAAASDLHSGLTIMRQNGYRHFWSWEPEFIKTILTFAVHNDIEKEYAGKLAADRLHSVILEKDTFPVMQVSLLGNFEINFSTGKTCQAQDFTPAQRELLSMLFSSKDHIISQDQAQLTLWPDSTPEKARSKMDTLLSRLRKIMAKACKPHSIKNYLSVRKGIIRLLNCSTDAGQFSHFTQKAMHHAKSDEWWQAGNAAYSATRLWQGSINTQIFPSELAQEYSNRLQRRLSQVSISWAANLAESGRIDEAIPVVEKAIRSNPLDENLIKLLYQIHTKNYHIVKAKEVLNSYTEALKCLDYGQEEIDGALDYICSSTPQ